MPRRESCALRSAAPWRPRPRRRRQGTLAAHGRLKGVLLRRGASWSALLNERLALDTVLSHLGILRVHQTHLRRVALLGDGAWVGQQGMLEKHFPDAEVRVGEGDEAEVLEGWLKGA